MSAMSHSLTNSLRQPATILAALVYAPMKLSPINIAGILLACAGGILYDFCRVKCLVHRNRESIKGETDSNRDVVPRATIKDVFEAVSIINTL